MTAIEQDFTPEQIAEWQSLHDEIAKLDDAYHKAQHEAGSWLTWGIERNDGEYAGVKALEEAARAVGLWAQRTVLYEQVQAHPYQAAVMARLDAMRAARAS